MYALINSLWCADSSAQEREVLGLVLLRCPLQLQRPQSWASLHTARCCPVRNVPRRPPGVSHKTVRTGGFTGSINNSTYRPTGLSEVLAAGEAALATANTRGRCRLSFPSRLALKAASVVAACPELSSHPRMEPRETQSLLRPLTVFLLRHRTPALLDPGATVLCVETVS